MKTQNVEAPPECPDCGARVCLEYAPGSSMAALHCGSEHDDPNTMCGWRMEITVEPDIEQLVVVSRWTGLSQVDHLGQDPANLRDLLGRKN